MNDAGGVVAALELPGGELREMAQRARQRTLDEHTGDRRARELLRFLESARRSGEREIVSAKEVA